MSVVLLSCSSKVNSDNFAAPAGKIHLSPARICLRTEIRWNRLKDIRLDMMLDTMLDVIQEGFVMRRQRLLACALSVILAASAACTSYAEVQKHSDGQ